MLLVRIDSYVARRTGRFAEALPLFRESVRLGVKSGDWSAEVNARNNLADLLWETGPIDEAAREACSVWAELRSRPSTSSDGAIIGSNVIGILSEIDRVDEASTAAREALTVMRRAQFYFPTSLRIYSGGAAVCRCNALARRIRCAHGQQRGA